MIKDDLWDLKPGLNVGRAALFQLFLGRIERRFLRVHQVSD
jgi:hypothetical protein